MNLWIDLSFSNISVNATIECSRHSIVIFIAHTVILPIICVLGIVGNAFNLRICYILQRRHPTIVAYRFFKYLASVDFAFFSLILHLAVTDCVICPYSVATRRALNYFKLYIIIPLNFLLIFVSTYLTVVISLDRYIVILRVSRNYQNQSSFVVRYFCFILLAMILIGFLLSLTTITWYKIVDDCYVATDFLSSNAHHLICWGLFLIMNVIPSVLVAWINWSLVGFLISKSKASRSITPSSFAQFNRVRVQMRLARVLMAMTAVMMIGLLPSGFSSPALAQLFLIDVDSKEYVIFLVTCNLIMSASFTQNIFIYLHYDVSFRNELGRLLRCS